MFRTVKMGNKAKYERTLSGSLGQEFYFPLLNCDFAHLRLKYFTVGRVPTGA
jgi:hypothetical protein